MAVLKRIKSSSSVAVYSLLSQLDRIPPPRVCRPPCHPPLLPSPASPCPNRTRIFLIIGLTKFSSNLFFVVFVVRWLRLTVSSSSSSFDNKRQNYFRANFLACLFCDFET